MINIIGKIVIIIIGVVAIGLLLLMMAGACDLMAKTYRETHKEDFCYNDYYDDEDDDYNNPYYTIKKYDES